MLTIKVSSGAGSEISNAIVEMSELARKLGVWVEQDINGINVHIHPTDDPKLTYEGWENARKSKKTYAIYPRSR